jgi:hypothetical protein
MRRHRRRMAEPMQITLRRRRREELIWTIAGIIVLAIIYTKMLGLW